MSLLSWERGLKFSLCRTWKNSTAVAPLVGAWIEISLTADTSVMASVAPLVGAWIEIVLITIPDSKLPVAPLVGAWIEIKAFTGDFKTFFVAPLVGAWIEIAYPVFLSPLLLSLLSWERGLKLH